MNLFSIYIHFFYLESLSKFYKLSFRKVFILQKSNLDNTVKFVNQYLSEA